MGEGISVRQQERDTLRYIIQQWNSNRLDLFEISEPDENLEFHGVMRFYFQDCGQKVATKCIRVSSSSTTRYVIETLIEKFRPDMRMLSTIPEYTLYEIHENGEERRLSEDEKPLLVQLNWNKDDREGRFLLRRMDLNGVLKMNSLPPVMSLHHSPPPAAKEETSFIRRLSKREKKEIKKQRKIANDNNNENSVAEKLYTELPETSFTRSISNPEVVMQKRRAQKLEKKLLEFRSKNGGPDTGGTLKIYGVSLCPDVPYKTLLLSVRDTASSVVKEMLEKYGLHREDPTSYCLVQCIVTEEEALDGYQGKIVPQKEYILDDDECPLAILMNHPKSRGAIMFQVRHRPADHGQRRRKKKPTKGSGPPLGGPHQQHPSRHHQQSLEDLLPYIVELGPDGNELGKGTPHRLHMNVTEVGSDRMVDHSGGAQSVQLFGPHIQPSHCVITYLEDIVTVTPSAPAAETYVNFKRIYETTILQHGSILRFGRTHTFRFMDPHKDERRRLQIAPPQPTSHHHPLPQQYLERPGHESISQPPPGSLMGSHFGSRANSIGGSQTSIARPPGRSGSEMALVRPSHEPWSSFDRTPPRDPILPAVLEFPEEVEDAFLHNVITQLDPTDIQFKLAPTYTLYMAARFRASTHYRPDLAPTERAQKLTVMLKKVATVVHEVIEYKQRDATSLAFWMANASELLHFLKQDRHICGYSLDAQDILAEAVQFAFRKLVEYMQSELSSAMPLFLEDRDDKEEEEGSTVHALSLLSNTMSLLRMCRVNAALTIQLFSQLFHYINMWAFNKIVTESCPNYCSRMWGERMKERVGRIELWAEKQGLELAADCHLAKLSQASLLLISPKSSQDDIASLSSTCFKLNSIQLREILEKYQLGPNEPPIPKELTDCVVSVAETTADGLAREDGREVRLEEDADLQLPFLLPEDGYSCDIVRSVPSGLGEFLDPLQRAQLCRMTPQPTSAGYWTIYMHNHQEIHGQRSQPGPRSPSAMSIRSFTVPRGEPELHTIHLQKFKSGMGLSIVATKGENQDQLGIYIKSVVPGGAADQDGRLQAGDQLLSVDGKTLVGISQEEAAQYMVGTGSVVTLEVARQGALYHGLAPLLAQPSPQVNRGSQDPRRDSGAPLTPGGSQPPMHHQPSHPNFPPQQRHGHPLTHPHPQHPGARMQPSKSVPSLNSEMIGAAPKKSDSHDAFNVRTSSVTSLAHPQLHPQQSQQAQHHHQQYPVRSRSTQNLNEGGALTLSGRHPSSPALNTEDDRHYQNVSFHQGTQDPRMGSRRGGRPPIFPPNHSAGPQQETHHRPASAFMQREEGGADSMFRPPSQQTTRPQDPRLTLPLGEEPRKRFNGYPGQGGPLVPPMSSPGFVQTPPGPGCIPASQRPQQQFIRGNPRYNSSHGGPPPQMSPHSAQPSQISPHGYFPQSPSHVPAASPHGVPPQHMSPQYSNSPQAHQMGFKQPPPTAPKPNRNSGSFGTDAPPEKPLRQGEGPFSRMLGPSHRSGSLEDSYRDSPPPPPPPTSTHPLMQLGPRGGHPSKQVGGKGPWSLDEKEKYEARKREAVRRWRDEQITSLETMESKSPQEEEILRTLKLEKEFQRRAEAQMQEEEEEGKEDDEGEDDDEEREGDDKGDRMTDVPSQFRMVETTTTTTAVMPNRTAQLNGNDSGGGGGKVEEIRRKQMELEVAQQTEEKLLKQAQRRHEEETRKREEEEDMRRKREDDDEARRQHHQLRHQSYASQRLDSLVGGPPLNGGRVPPSSVSPLPPERGSSYSVMNQHTSGGEKPTRGLHGDPIKRVQFSETPTESRLSTDSNSNHEMTSTGAAVREDPNAFIDEAENLMNSTSPNRPTGNTPGVIGAQEVYRDPRQRRLNEQAQKAAAGKGPVPEKLTFREKMKMFAKEADEAKN